MNRRLLLAGVAALAACSPAQLAEAQQAIQIACQIDGVAQSVVAIVVQAVGGASGATLVTADNALVHPAIKAACTALAAQVRPGAGGVPASATLMPAVSS